jgi:FtsP/CotA-like multicopper oxidase with cupredoxin domain
MMGRQGNLLLVNGRAHPQLTVKPGATLRWRIVNAAASRYFRLALPGHAFTVVGTDGGALPEARAASELLLAPGERLDVVFAPAGEAGSALELMSLPVERGHMMTVGVEQPLIQLAFRDDGEAQGVAPPAPGPAIPELSAFTRTRSFVLEEAMSDSGSMGGGMDRMGGMTMQFSINGEMWPDVTPLQAKLGEPERWVIDNRSPMDHPFHLHGFFFQVLSRDGVPTTTRAWKDTVNVPANGTLTLGTPLDGHPGRWLIHCHILEHAERGMTAELDVAP